MTILVPIFEEIVCRGVIQQTYFKDSPFYFDVLISSIIFAIGHLIGGIFYPLLFYCTVFAVSFMAYSVVIQIQFIMVIYSISFGMSILVGSFGVDGLKILYLF